MLSDSRPVCRRCNGPLDIWNDEDVGIGFVCNSPKPMQTDEQFRLRVASLTWVEVAQLQRQLVEE